MRKQVIYIIIGLRLAWHYQFYINIPMLARYDGQRRIDIDPLQLCDLEGILDTKSSLTRIMGYASWRDIMQSTHIFLHQQLDATIIMEVLCTFLIFPS